MKEQNDELAKRTIDQYEKEERKKAGMNILKIIIFIVIVAGGFFSGCIRCTYCGADDNRLLIYASGTGKDGIEYKSCVGPAGILGFGLNSKCWPTECESVKIPDETLDMNASSTSGCVTYYNEVGCIAKSGVKSEGKYSSGISCSVISCAANNYVETTAETTKAKEQFTCLGMGCGDASATDSLGLNSKMPRQFKTGCWSAQ